MAAKRLSKARLLTVFSVLLLLLAGLLLRLGFVQIFKSPEYLSKQEIQSRRALELKPTRGRILDREGRVFALDVRLDSVYAESRRIQEKEKTAKRLTGVLDKGYEWLLERLSRDKLFVWLARKVPVATSEAVARLELKGIGFLKESLRAYPKGKTAAHLIGFTDIDNKGLEGIELRYDYYLRGVPGWKLSRKDAKQRELISKETKEIPPTDGYDVHLTIDEVIQSMAEKILEDTCERFNALGGSIVVLEPHTGDLLALANYPSFDPNHVKETSPEVRRNRGLTDLFEPGSVFKVITLAAVLGNGVFGLDETFDCEKGSWAVAGRILHDHRGHGRLTFREIIEKSSNIGTVKGAMRLGKRKMYEAIRAFGFGEKTQIGLPGEVSGIVPHPGDWSRSSIINIPIGQGVAVTSVQLAQALGAIANDGLLLRPRIVSRITDPGGTVVKTFEREVVRRVLSATTARQVRSVMEGVVERGTGRKARVPGFAAGGKTGTAQKVLPGGGYSHDDFVASFTGFVPADKPKLVIVVNIDEPRPVYYGGLVAAPAFARLAESILAYWRIGPEEGGSLLAPEEEVLGGEPLNLPRAGEAARGVLRQ